MKNVSTHILHITVIFFSATTVCRLIICLKTMEIIKKYSNGSVRFDWLMKLEKQSAQTSTKQLKMMIWITPKIESFVPFLIFLENFIQIRP